MIRRLKEFTINHLLSHRASSVSVGSIKSTISQKKNGVFLLISKFPIDQKQSFTSLRGTQIAQTSYSICASATQLYAMASVDINLSLEHINNCEHQTDTATISIPDNTWQRGCRGRVRRTWTEAGMSWPDRRRRQRCAAHHRCYQQPLQVCGGRFPSPGRFDFVERRVAWPRSVDDSALPPATTGGSSMRKRITKVIRCEPLLQVSCGYRHQQLTMNRQKTVFSEAPM